MFNPLLQTRVTAMVVACMLLTATVLSGCGVFGSCTEIGCLDGLSLSFDHSAGAAPADGSYTLEVKDNANGATEVCTLTLTNGVVSEASGSCLAEGLDGTVRFFNFVPTNITLTLSDTSDAIASDTRVVRYIESQPNGPGCDPECFHKTESFDISQ